jgi:hypothetical protein
MFLPGGKRMTDSQTQVHSIEIEGQPQALKFLTLPQIAMIDEALAALEDFGEIRLVVEKNRLRFIITQKSYDALKWRPGSLSTERV